MDKQRVLKEINAIYNNCKEHMANTVSDWKKVYDAFYKLSRRYNNDPWVVDQVVGAYERLEDYWKEGAANAV